MENRPTRFIFGDVESTGLGKNQGVVEISWIETDAEFNEVERYGSLINPQKPIQFGAMSVHGITEAMVADAPTIEQFMANTCHPLSGPGTILVAHNASYDIEFFGPWMDKPDTLCTLKCARVLYPEAEGHKLGILRCMLGLEGDTRKAHSAQEDVSVLIQLAQRMCRDAGTDLYGLLEVQRRPRPINVMPFGKHKGTKLADLPNDYIFWLLNRCENLDPDLRTALMAL